MPLLTELVDFMGRFLQICRAYGASKWLQFKQFIYFSSPLAPANCIGFLKNEVRYAP
jgi:hypothetical protein